MGRYYNGDINGKFGFGSQDSTDGEYFGAWETEGTVIDYCINNDDIPEAIDKLKELIIEFRADTGNKTLTTTTTQDEFWDMVDTTWYQDTAHGLLASRIAMGLEIAQFNRNNPDDDIYFTAEL